MKRSFFYLAAVTVTALLILLVFAPGDESPQPMGEKVLLLPVIAERINDVDQVEIVSAGNNLVASLRKTPLGWTFEQMSGYRADWSKLQPLLTALATSEVVENKTNKPEYYARLGVEDISNTDAESVLVKVGFKGQISGVLIGHQAQGRPGQYVRIQGAADSALIDQQIDVSINPLDWADSRIIDINSSEVAEVEVIHPDGDRVFATRFSADQTDFDLVEKPFDRELKSSWAVNSLGSVLAMLNMESVRADDDIDWGEAIRFRMLTFSGVEIIADVMQSGDVHLLRLTASSPLTEVKGAETPEEGSVEARASADVKKIVDDINEKATNWAYLISKSKYDVISKKKEDLLKPVEAS